MTRSADEIIERAFRGDATAEELEWLTSWRRDALRNEQQYRRTIRLLSAVRGLPAAPQRRPPSAASLIAQARGPVRITPERRSHAFGRSLAAAGVVAALGIGGFVLRERVGRASGLLPDPVGYSTGQSEMATVQLSDGSVVRLAPASKLRFVQKKGMREATLEGRAFFSISKVDGSPFRVHTRLGDATVLGTRFELAADSAELKLVVVSGRVALSAGAGGSANAVQVAGGEQSSVRNGAARQPEPVPHAETMSEWVGRFLAFRSTPMDEVAREVGEAYGIRIVIADSAVRSQTFSGTFIDRDAKQVIADICPAVGAVCELRAGTVIMTAR